MAKFWDNLKYHEDTVKKEKLTKEDITFLKDLQKELNTEDTVGTASPRFWVIKQPERVYHIDKDEAEHYMFIETDSHCELTLEDLKEKLEYLFDENLKDIKIEYNELIFKYYDEDFEEEEEYTIDFDNNSFSSDNTIGKILELLKDEVEVFYYKEIDVIVPNCLFLTQIDAENHLRNNDYHYHEEARTYCMCGWRSPRLEKLINILSKTDFDDIEVK